MASFEIFKKLLLFNLELHNKINQIESYLNVLTTQIEHREKYLDFAKHNEQYKQYILQEKLLYLEQLHKYKELYINANNTRYI